jgi:hypothetical protein
MNKIPLRNNPVRLIKPKKKLRRRCLYETRPIQAAQDFNGGFNAPL